MRNKVSEISICPGCHLVTENDGPLCYCESGFKKMFYNGGQLATKKTFLKQKWFQELTKFLQKLCLEYDRGCLIDMQ